MIGNGPRVPAGGIRLAFAFTPPQTGPVAPAEQGVLLAIHEIELPRVPRETPLDDAIQIMQRSGKSAVVVERPNGLAVLTAGELVETLREKPDLLVGELQPISAVSQVPAPRETSQLLYSQTARHGVDMAFSGSPQYSLLDMGNSRALLVTTSEAIALIMGRTSTICRCTDNPHHVYLREELTAPGKCNTDGKPVNCT
jgi:CBS domain-containing protein